MTVAGELLTSVVEGFVTDGLRRGYQEIQFALRRRHAIDRAASGSGRDAEKNVLLSKAIRDLEIVIGSKRGELSEPIAAFIREVEKSAIPESIVRCVLSNGEPGSIYPAFDVIYRAFSASLSFDPKNFFNAFYVAIKLRVEQQVKDPAMLEFLQVQNKELSRQLAEISRALRTSSELTAPLSAPEISDARLKLARSFELTCSPTCPRS